MDYRDPEWASERLSVDKNTLYKFLQDGTIPAIQLGRKWLISESKLEQWLSEETDRQTRARRESMLSVQRTVRRMSNLSRESRDLLRDAYAEARRYGHRHLSQEHILLACSASSETLAGKILKDLGLPPSVVRETIESKLQPGEGAPPRRPGRKPRAKVAMRLAAAEAARTGSKRIEPQHLLLGIALSSGTGAAQDLLSTAGITPERIREKLTELEPPPTKKET